jgi:hypothetical protein
MKITRSSLVLGLLSSVFVAGVSGASPADNAAPPSSGASSAKIAEKDFGRLSIDGVSAFNDVHLARVAIFEGKTDEAAKFVADARASLGKAKTDDAVFIKAESALRDPSKPASDPAGSRDSISSPIAWIPIDSELILGETYQSTPEAAAAVVTARKGLEKGDGAASLGTIKSAKVDVDYVVAVAPLEKSIADVGRAGTLMISHDYYGASQALRTAEVGIRYDEIDDVANVKPDTSTVIAKGK